MGKVTGRDNNKIIRGVDPQKPKVKNLGKTKQSQPIGQKGGISGAGLPAPRVTTLRGTKGDER